MEKSFLNQLNPLINGNSMSGKGNNGELEGRAKVQKKASKKEKGIRSAYHETMGLGKLGMF